MTNENYKRNETVIQREARLSGLKKYSEEINRVVVESLEQALFKLLKTKDYSKITVTELCAVAGVSRMGFYGNFSHKDEIIRSVILRLSRTISTNSGSPFRKTTTKQWYIDFFALMKSQADIIKVIFEVGFESKCLAILNDTVLYNPTTPTEKKYQRLLWSGAISNAVRYWVITEMKESVEDMAEYCMQNLVPWSYDEKEK